MSADPTCGVTRMTAERCSGTLSSDPDLSKTTRCATFTKVIWATHGPRRAPERRAHGGEPRGDRRRLGVIAMSAATPATPATPAALVELDRGECLRLLATAAVGRIVVLTAGQAPVIRPVNFVFDERSQSVVFRCTGGTKLIALLGAARAWFEIDEIDAARRTGWSVIVAGVTEPVTQSHEVARLARLALHSWVAGPDAHWFGIRARVVSGWRLQTPGPGADPRA
jgi:nitroimidazol reductase NimA-like FMN-containing flavoprotein (pyridoxamine 5'-phosphate oxidase superfamily)